MARYRYKGSLAKYLTAGMEPQVKLKDLYKDLGVDPVAPSAAKKALMALAKRHVPGFQNPPSDSSVRGKPGRRSAFGQKQIDAADGFPPLWSSSSMESHKLILYDLITYARKKLRTRGGRSYTKLELVTMLSKEPRNPKSGSPNPYFGMNPKTLLSWVTHAGPNSKLRRKRDKETKEWQAAFKKIVAETDFKAKSKDTA